MLRNYTKYMHVVILIDKKNLYSNYELSASFQTRTKLFICSLDMIMCED